MKTYQDFKKDEVIESKIDVTCIGAFDGLHRGCLLYTSDAADE